MCRITGRLIFWSILVWSSSFFFYLSGSGSVFLLVIHSGMSTSSKHVCYGWRWIFKTRIHIFHHRMEFSKLVFFQWCSEGIEVYFCFQSFSSPCNSFSMSFYPFGFSVIISTFSYFAPKLFYVLRIWLLVYLRAFSPYMLLEFSFVVLECPVLSVLFKLLLHPAHWEGVGKCIHRQMMLPKKKS